jgi:hypothetical protein
LDGGQFFAAQAELIQPLQVQSELQGRAEECAPSSAILPAGQTMEGLGIFFNLPVPSHGADFRFLVTARRGRVGESRLIRDSISSRTNHFQSMSTPNTGVRVVFP